jgi:rhodanese-related sulfurtransferase
LVVEMLFSKPIPEIHVEDLAQKLKSSDAFVLLDVRERDEIARAKISDPRLIILPLSVLSRGRESSLPQAIHDRGAEIHVLCHHGVRSADVTRWLIKQGWTNVHSVRGGIHAYAAKIDKSIGMY